ncbi:carbonic anhydrase [Xylariomycetidae sp. FL2044]|nr:carbonic anhydrase [Xylariomycetidae sp. FL2044]
MAIPWTDMLERNRVYSQSKHQPEPYIDEIAKLGREPPSTFIFSCLDFRASAEQLLDLKGDEAFIVRNLGGRVTDMSSLSNLLFIEQITQGQALKDVAIIHHNDCGLTHLSKEDVRGALKSKVPHLADQIDQISFEAYDGSSIEKHKEAVQHDLKFITDSPLIREELKKNVKGYVYDIKSGQLLHVPHSGI